MSKKVCLETEKKIEQPSAVNLVATRPSQESRFISHYSPKLRVAVLNRDDAPRAKQAFKDECDINNVLAKYNKTGQLPDLIKQNPQYGDFADSRDYQESLNLVMLAHEQFNALPAHARDRFGNNPEAFLNFVNDPKNVEELVDMGLATKKEKPATKAPEAVKNDPTVKEGSEPKK